MSNKQPNENFWLQKGLMMFAETTGWIAIPIIGALYLGRWLDTKQGTEPLYFLSITAGAFIISCIGIGITGVKYIKQIEAEEALKKNKDLTGEIKKSPLSKGDSRLLPSIAREGGQVGGLNQNNDTRQRKSSTE